MLPRPGGSGKSKDDSSMAAALEVVIVHSPANSKEQRLIAGGQEASSSCCRRKQRNNATQTRLDAGSCCCVITTHHHHCHCHRHHHHHHHHCHYRSTKRRALLQQKRSHHQHHHNHNPHLPIKQTNPNQMLPTNNNNNKSSLDSSEEGMLHHQAIAIEIDAATMSEDCGDENNSSTATSNFPYKVASEGVKPIIMAPLREQHRHRRTSLNSNTTIETDELSHDEDDDDVRMGSHHLPEDETQLTQPPNTSSSSPTKRGNPSSAPARNECVRIKRKRFIAEPGQDYCSSCSSSCSCSSLDEDHLEGQAHEMTVSAECHQCMPSSRRGSFCSCHNSSCCCGSGSQEEEEEEADDEDDDETTGQRESFCTAADHTITPSQEGEDMHSSTLTPLSTHRSSFMDNADNTMRSDDNGGGNLTDADASSLSQSAEYFSLSSTAGGATSYPIKEEKPKDTREREADPHPSCKHWNPRNPHSKHKRASSPVDSSL